MDLGFGNWGLGTTLNPKNNTLKSKHLTPKPNPKL
jgi:hypothetical protein